MNDKEIKKLGRADLLELLITQAEENEKLRIRLEEAEKQLSDRSIILDECGSIAEASLKLNGIFATAQNAADEYLENIKVYARSREEIFKRHEDAARISAERIIAEAEKQCRLMEDEASRKCDEMLRIAKKESEKYWESVSSRIEEQLKQKNQSNSQEDDKDEE